MCCCPGASPHSKSRKVALWVQHRIRLTSLSFQVNWPSHSWYMFIWKFNLENPSPMGKVKVTYWIQKLIDSHPFCSISTDPPILGIWLFHNFTMKVQGQEHRSRSHNGFNIQSTHIHFVLSQSNLQIKKSCISGIGKHTATHIVLWITERISFILLTHSTKYLWQALHKFNVLKKSLHNDVNEMV